MALADLYFPASYGGIDLLVASISSELGRDVAVQSPARGDKHVNQDRGKRQLASSAEIAFVDQPGKAPYMQRLLDFVAMVNGDNGVGAQVFVHPLLGSYSARITDVNVRAEATTLSAEVTCKILAEDPPQFTQQVGAGVSTVAGQEAVSVASENATSALAAIGATSTVPTNCLSQVQAWVQATDLDSQQVFAEVATLTSAINAAIDTLELTRNINNWAAYQAMILLEYQVMRAAAAATSDADQVFDIVITVPRPLLAICADVYGASLAEDRADRIASMNRIRNPGLVPVGTIKMISEGASA